MKFGITLKTRKMLRIESLYLSLDGKSILEDINLEIKEGDFLALIGPNGGGKSTLIRCILGFLKPNKGNIYLWDKPLETFKEWYKVGYVPQRAGQEINLMNPLTVGEFLELPFLWYKLRVDKDHLSYLCEKFGIKEHLSKKIYHLSFGQLQRVYLVRALSTKPKVLILDEPSVGLDFVSQEIFYKILSEFHQKGLTIILITHETWLITKEVNKVACLNQKLYFHGEHEDFCLFAEREVYWFNFHKIEHCHW